MMPAAAVYRALLHFYPAAFRQEYGNQMLLMFTEQLGEARRTGGRLEQGALWMRATLDTLIIAPKEHCHVIVQDLRYALRIMAASLTFTAVAVLSLALGIGANTAIFSLWNSVLHSSLPVVLQPEKLVMLSDPDESGSWTGRWDGTDGPRAWLTYSEFEQLRDHADRFSGLMASQSSLSDWQGRFEGGGWEPVRGRFVSGGFFQLLGVHPAIGQLFSTADDRAEVPYAVISYNFWQRRFGGRHDVLGKTFAIRNAALTVIGVAPRGFIGETSGQQPDLWLPLKMQPYVAPGADRLHDTPPIKSMWLHVFGRLKPGVTRAQAEAQANAIFQAGLESFYGEALTGARRSEYLDQHLKISAAARGASETRKEFSSSLTALLAAVGVLLLIACANLANLLLARGAARKPEIALRLSLGATRGRLIRQLITESLVLAAMGGVAAVATAYFLHGALVRVMTESDDSFDMGFTLDPQVLGFLAGTTLLAALLFSMLPAWQMTSLKEQSRGAIGQMHWGRFLVSLQLALSLPLLVGAGLLARTVFNLRTTDLGFPADHLLRVRVELREAAQTPAGRDHVRRELLAEIQRIPGVRAASFSQLGVFSGGDSSLAVEVEDHTRAGDDDRSSSLDVVGPGYFSTLGVRIVQGREILERDQTGATNACVINEAFARRFFDRRNPLGMHITSIYEDQRQRVTYQIVGVAKDARTQRLRGDVKPRYFVPTERPEPLNSPIFLIRTSTAPAPVMDAVRKTIQRVGPSLPILGASSIEELMAPQTAQDRITAQLAMVFGSIALALAAIGLYGVLSYGIARRKSEIAVRIALGAQPGRVVGMILQETSGVVIVGMALGGGLAYAASRLISSRLYGVAPQDPLTLALATGLLLIVALSAAYLPARRASRLDPMAALRQE